MVRSIMWYASSLGNPCSVRESDMPKRTQVRHSLSTAHPSALRVHEDSADAIAVEYLEQKLGVTTWMMCLNPSICPAEVTPTSPVWNRKSAPPDCWAFVRSSSRSSLRTAFPAAENAAREREPLPFSFASTGAMRQSALERRYGSFDAWHDTLPEMCFDTSNFGTQRGLL